MSYFLEDTKKRRSTSAVLVDYTGMNEALFNSEVAWGNIMESAMKSEYVAIKNESQTLLEASVNDALNSIKEWFKNMIATIARVVANIKNKILIQMDFYGKYAIKAEKILIKNKDFINKKTGVADVNINIYDVNDKLEGLLKTSEQFSSIAENASKNPIKAKEKKSEIEKLNKIYKDFYDAIKNDSAKKELPLYEAVGFVKNNIDKLKSISKVSVKKALLDFDSAIKRCKEAIALCDKKQESEKIKDYKTSITIINQCSSRFINIRMSVASIYKKNISAVISKLKKTDDVETKTNDVETKTESYFGF